MVAPATWLRAGLRKFENVDANRLSAGSRLRKFLTIVISRAYESDGLTCELTVSCIKVRSTNGYEPQDPNFRVIMQVRTIP